MAAMRFVDLFSGMGSFHYSFGRLGWKCVLACDIDPSSRCTYEHHYGIRPCENIMDIRPKDMPRYDILCAGFPCQPFSSEGLRKGFEDPRGNMVFEVFRIMKGTRPPIVVLENVPGLVNHNQGKTFQTICKTMQKLGYEIAWDMWQATDFGIPQTRKRVFIVGVRKDWDRFFSPKRVFEVDRYKKTTSLARFFRKPFERTNAHTIRTGGHGGKFGANFTWDVYMVDGKEYRLTLRDLLRLQGFPSGYKLCGPITHQRKQLGNTIPTIFTRMIGENIQRSISKTSRKEVGV